MALYLTQSLRRRSTALGFFFRQGAKQDPSSLGHLDDPSISRSRRSSDFLGAQTGEKLQGEDAFWGNFFADFRWIDCKLCIIQKHKEIEVLK